MHIFIINLHLLMLDRIDRCASCGLCRQTCPYNSFFIRNKLPTKMRQEYVFVLFPMLVFLLGAFSRQHPRGFPRPSCIFLPKLFETFPVVYECCVTYQRNNVAYGTVAKQRQRKKQLYNIRCDIMCLERNVIARIWPKEEHTQQ
jgi:Fe-S-cluster-containing hydrogenase component 2